jgi:hypothetical protein
VTGTGGGPGGRAPDLLFCRRCGVSVPRREFLAGRAVLHEGRAWCPSCAPRALLSRRAFRGALGAGAAAAAALLALGLHAAFRDAGAASGEARRAGEAAAAAAAAAASAGERVGRLEAEARALAEIVRAEGRALADLKGEAGRAREEFEDRLGGVERSLGTVLDAVEALRRDLAASRGPAVLTDAEEEELLARLDDANPGIRFESLWRLQRGSGAAARAAAVRGLGDPEDGVRWQAAVLARSLRVEEAAPALVECLAFPNAAVRSAAVEALRALTGTDLGFDPLEPSEERRGEAIARWRARLGE